MRVAGGAANTSVRASKPSLRYTSDIRQPSGACSWAIRAVRSRTYSLISNRSAKSLAAAIRTSRRSGWSRKLRISIRSRIPPPMTRCRRTPIVFEGRPGISGLVRKNAAW
jgi:hypothetical protein